MGGKIDFLKNFFVNYKTNLFAFLMYKRVAVKMFESAQNSSSNYG